MRSNLPNSTVPEGTANRGSSPIFYLFMGMAIILPPIGVASGLVFLTTGEDFSRKQKNYQRGMTLIIVGIAAFLIQLILGSIFIFPKAIDFFSTRIAKLKYPSGFSGANPHNYKSDDRKPEEVMLLAMVSGHFGGISLEQEYQARSEKMAAGSTEPIDRYVNAIILSYSEVAEDLIPDRDERKAEIERLIVDGLESDGENAETEEKLDVIMLTPYARTQLYKGNYDKAREIIDRLYEFQPEYGDVAYYNRLKVWAYNSVFAFWQIRDPERAIDFALDHIREHVWSDGLPPWAFFYNFRGGIGNLYHMAHRYGRESEVFDLLQFFKDSTPDDPDIKDNHISLLYRYTAYVLALDGQWDKAAGQYQLGNAMGAKVRDYLMPEAISLYNAGRKLEAAELVFMKATGDITTPLLMDEIRYLFQDTPDEGLSFLLGKLQDHHDDKHIAENIAILATVVGDDDLANAAYELMRVNESEIHGSLARDIADAIESGNYTLTRKLTLQVDFDLKPLTADSAYAHARINFPFASAEEAANLTRQILELDPVERDPDFPIFATYFESMRELGKLDEAFDFLDRIINYDQNLGYPRFFKATKLREEGRIQESLEAFSSLQQMMGIPGKSLLPKMPSPILNPLFKGSYYWYSMLNLLSQAEVNLLIAELSRELGLEDEYRHHLYIATREGHSDFEAQMANFSWKLEKGNLEGAGEILDHISFFREVEDPDSDEYARLIQAYDVLKRAGWVRDRNFTPPLKYKTEISISAGTG